MDITSIGSNDAVKEFDSGFDKALPQIVERAVRLLAEVKNPLFFTNADPDRLWEIYLGEVARIGGDKAAAHLNCGTCRDTVRKIGPVVTVDDEGNLVPLLWSPELDGTAIQSAFALVYKEVEKAKIISQWATDKQRVGVAENTSKTTGATWTHFYVDLPLKAITVKGIHEPHEFMAKSQERFKTLMNDQTGIHRISIDVLNEALRLFTNNELDRAERFAPMVKFHIQVKESLSGNRKSGALVWKQLALSPNGWENANSTMVGQLYAMIKNGDSLGSIKSRWNVRVDGKNFQRPKAAPTQGNIVQAEALIAKMGLEKSLERRFARFEDVRCIWKPLEEGVKEAPKKGLFSHLSTKGDLQQTKTPYDLTPKQIDWEKFELKVLPQALEIELQVPQMAGFASFVTAVHADAPPILTWDTDPDNRYPVSSYVYTEETHAAQWGLQAGYFAKLKGIAKTPGYEKAYILIIEGAADRAPSNSLALFPDNLRGELHGIRSTIEAFSGAGKLSGQEEASAAGLQFNGRFPPFQLKVTTTEGVFVYNVDRME